LGALLLEEWVAIGLSFLIVIVGAASSLLLVFVQVDAYVVGPLLLLLVPCRALDATTGLFNSAVQGWMQRVFRLIVASVIACFALVLLSSFLAQLAAVSAANPTTTFGSVLSAFFWVTMAVLVIAGLTVTLPFAIGAALGGGNIANPPAALERAQNAAANGVRKITSRK